MCGYYAAQAAMHGSLRSNGRREELVEPAGARLLR
jgi:hypothetical protein